jgi:hypothetical protein
VEITGDKFETVTDSEGKYKLNLPRGLYHVLLHWYGDCSQVRRAPFKLETGDDFTFDFLLVSCRIVDTEKDDAGSLRNNQDANMSIPLAEQAPEYREQVISAASNGRPEILVSFGKYDNQRDCIEYFSLDNQVIKNLSSYPMLPMPLPVTVTVDRYTIGASTVVWHKKAMTFHFAGDVSVSDGHMTSQARSASLSFSKRVPIVHTDSDK